MGCLQGRGKAWGSAGWCPGRQQPRYQPAPSQACPALGRPEPDSAPSCPRGSLWLALAEEMTSQRENLAQGP